MLKIINWKELRDNVYNSLLQHGHIKIERIVQNINMDLTTKQKTVLLCYMDLNKINFELQTGILHTNRYELYQIINCLISYNLIIDICACYDVAALDEIGNKRYDYIFGLGKVYREISARQPSAYKILYLTENPYYVSLKKEQERIDYLYQRCGIKTELVRTGAFYEEDDEKSADCIICMGDTQYLRHIQASIYRIIPSASRNMHYSNKTNNRNKCSFLVLGTDGFIHKGNDLLIEVFNKHPEWNLFLCGGNISKELRKYKYTSLNGNIFDCGFVDIQSNEFLELVSQCTFILLPSCSEAPSTAILTGMRHGLIPIVSKGNGLELFEEYCYFFKGYQIEEIEEKICEVVELSEDKLKEKSENIYQFANEAFTLEKYTESLNNILGKVFEEVRSNNENSSL